MRLFVTLSLVLILSTVAFGQTTTTTTTTPTTVYESSYRVIDTFGNLVVFDSGFTYTPSTTTGHRDNQSKSPVTQITIVRPTGAPVTQQFAGSFVVLGVGTHGVYAIATTTASYLVAINPQVGLPTAVTGFTNLTLPTTRFDVDMGQPDTLSILTDPLTTSTTTGTTTTRTTTPRTVKVVKFDGTNFNTVSTATLP
jgi:hypothetical protein